MSEIMSVWEFYRDAAPALLLYSIVVPIIILYSMNYKANRADSLFFTKGFYDLDLIWFTLMALIGPLLVFCGAVFLLPERFSFSLILALLAGLILSFGPVVLILSYAYHTFQPRALGVTCLECSRFVHFAKWICGYCTAENKNWFVHKCEYCKRRPSHLLCPHCTKSFELDPKAKHKHCAEIAPAPAIPYEEQEAELQLQMENLEREAKMAEMRARVREKQADVKRATESFGLDRVEQMRRAVEAQVEHELSKNLEQKLVFSRMREKIKTTYANDSGLQRDALSVLDSLEERAKTEAMRRPQRA
jgi:hypothetical protein